MINEAIILAGGLGTRLRTVVSDLPKCMAPVNGIPFINFIISYLSQQGVTRFIFSLGYKNEIVIEHLNKKFPGLDMEFVIEGTPLGTGGAIRKACNNVKGTDTFILNADTKFHIDKAADFSMALKQMKNFDRYGSVEINTNNRLQAFNEKHQCSAGLINAGVYALKVSSLFAKALPDIFSFEKEYLQKYILTDKFYGLAFPGYFIDIGIPEDYTRFIEDYNIISTKNNLHKTVTGNFVNQFFFDSLSSINKN